MRATGGRAAGFTLLELLVVLAVVALGTGLAVPRLAGWLERAEARSWRLEVLHFLQQQPLAAYADGRARTFDRARLLAEGPALPEGLDYKLERPLRYHTDGTASGGVLIIISAKGEPLERVTVSPLSGDVSLAEPRP